MKDREVRELLTMLVDELPGAFVDAGLTRNSCILATRCAVEVVRQRGGRAVPLSVRVEAQSPEWVRRVGEGQQITEENHREWVDAGAWVVSLGHGGADPEASGWDGHLVAIVEGRYLLDLTIGQVARPAKGIEARPFWVEVPPGFVRGTEGGAMEPGNGTVIEYVPVPSDRSFLTAPAWRGYRVRVANGRVVMDRTIPFPPDVKAAAQVVVEVGS